MILLILSTLIAAAHLHVIPLAVVYSNPQLHPIYSLYHGQDALGQYSYGYATPTSTKSETKTSDGVTRGGYSYIDSNGHLQSIQYTADPLHGFRVAATNLPKDLPEVALEKAKHLAQFHAIKADHAGLAAQTVQYSNPVAVPISAVPQVPLVNLPQPVQDLPEVAQAKAAHLAALHAAYSNPGYIPQIVQDLPEVIDARNQHLAAVEATKARNEVLHNAALIGAVPENANVVIPIQGVQTISNTLPLTHSVPVVYAPISVAPVSQYHAQDNWGQYSYGYVGDTSAKSESRTADGVTRGGYSYIDGNGIVQTVHYIADALHGFRTVGTNLPVGPSGEIPGSIPVSHTQEVIARVPVTEIPQVIAVHQPVVASYAHKINF